MDLTLVRRDDGTVGPRAATVDVRFSGGTGESTPELAVVGKDDREVGIGWSGALPEPTLDGRTATYHDVLPGVNLLLTVKHFGFRQVLEITDAEAARNPRLEELAFRSHTRNVDLRAGESSDIEARDESGSVVFRGDASRMWDSRGSRIRSAADTAEIKSSSPARADMDVEIGEGEVVVRPDREFLTSPDRVFPVYVDPEYEWAGQKQNHVVVQSAWPNQQNYNRTDGDLADLKAGVQGGYTSRSFFDFHVGDMHGKVIHAATVRTRVIHSWACGGPATQLWLTGGIWPSTTWNTQPSWSSKLDDITRSNHAQYCPSDGHAEADVLSAMREAAKGEWDRPTITFGLRAESAANEAWRRFALDPVLQVTYNSVPDVPGELGMEGGELPCTTGEDRAFVPTSTPRLRGKVSDPDGGMLEGRFALYTGEVGTGTRIWEETVANVPSGSFAEVTVPDGLVTEEGVYHWSMYASDGGNGSAWVGDCEFGVDHTAPSEPSVTSTDYPGGGETPGGGVGRTGTFTFGAAGTEDVEHYLWSVTEEENDDPQTRVDADRLGGTATVRWTPTLDGPQTVFVRSVDRAGNRSEIVRYKILVRAREPLSGAAGHWKLDGNLDDSSPNDLGLSATADTEVAASGYKEGAVRFDNASQRLYHPGPVLDTSSSFSVSAWAKLDEVGGWPAIASQDGEHTSGFQLQASPDGNWSMAMFSKDGDGNGDQVRAISSQPVQTGVWTHVMGVYDDGAERLRLYINGSLAAEKVYDSPWSASGDLQIGAALWNDYRVDHFPGVVDDVRVYQRVIVDSEAEALANEAVLRAHYPFDEGAGDVATDSVTGDTAEFVGKATWENGEYSAVGIGTEGWGRVDAPRPEIRTDRSYTVSAWVRLDDLDSDHARTAVSFAHSDFSPFMLQYRYGAERWAFLLSLGPDAENGWPVRSAQKPVEGEWTHLTAVYDHARAEARLYVNGQFSAVRTDVSGWNGPGGLTIGEGTWVGRGVDPWNGAVRDVRLYSGAVSDQQIGQLPI